MAPASASDCCSCCFAGLRWPFASKKRTEKVLLYPREVPYHQDTTNRRDELSPSVDVPSTLASAGELEITRAESTKPLTGSAQVTAPLEMFFINGFPALPELEVIRINDKANVAPFSFPQEALTFEPDVAAVTNMFTDGSTERMIHNNIWLSGQEQSDLRLLRQEAVMRGISFLPNISISASRYIMEHQGDVNKAIQKMQAVQDWYLEFFKNGPISDIEIRDALQYGIVYFCGRDYALRPVLVIRPARTPKRLRNAAGGEVVAKALIFCVEYFKRYMQAPGRVESMVVILDVKDVTVFNVAMQPVLHVLSVMQNQPAGSLCNIFVCNMSKTCSTLMRLILAACGEGAKQKVVIVKELAELRRNVAKHQLEEDLGGTAPVADKFLPFPLHAGPFDPACKSGPNPQAVPCVHEAISVAGFRGRIWDADLSQEENTQLEYTAEATHIYEKCNLPTPAGLASGFVSMSADVACSKALAETPSSCETASTASASTNASPYQDTCASVDDVVVNQDTCASVDDVVVRPAGVASCCQMVIGSGPCC